MPPIDCPNNLDNEQRSRKTGASSSSSSVSDEDSQPIHKVAEDLKVSVQDATARDDPARYYYKVQIIEEDKLVAGKVNEGKAKGKETNKSKYSGSLMDVKSAVMRYAPPHTAVMFLCPDT